MSDSDSQIHDTLPPLNLEPFRVIDPDIHALEDYKIVGFDSRDSRVRPFNLLRTQFAKQTVDKGMRLVGITSATPSAGKSFLSLNLAASLSKVSDRPVLLVDLDLRRGSLAAELGMDVTKGVSDYLSGEVESFGEIGYRVQDSQLLIFPTKKVTADSAELVASKRFAEMVAYLRDLPSQPLVIFDLPPAFASDDAMLSLDHLDGYVLVVDSGRTNKRQVQDTVVMLQPTPCVGTILNRYKGGIADSYGYGYGYSNYNKYYSD